MCFSFCCSRPADAGLGAVLSNNIVTINKDQNVFDSKRKMKSATVDSVKAKLTALQKQTIAVNQCLLHLYSNQVSDHCLVNIYSSWGLFTLAWKLWKAHKLVLYLTATVSLENDEQKARKSFFLDLF